MNRAAYRNRIQRGDTQLLGRQALAVQAAYTFNERWSGSFEDLQSLTDFSCVQLPSVSWNFSERMSLQGAIYYGYGPVPRMACRKASSAVFVRHLF